MNRKVRSHVNRGIGAVAFTNAHVAPDAVSTPETQVQALVDQARQLMALQDQSQKDERAASARKFELRRLLRQAHLVHIAATARLASAEVPDLATTVRLPRALPYVQFASVTRGILEVVNQHLDVMLKYGLDKSVVAGTTLALDQLDAAIKQGADARQARSVATATLGTVAAHITAQVRQIDGTYRARFVDQPELLAGWRTAIKLNLPRAKSPESSDGSTPPAQSPTTPPAADEIKPAA